MNETYLFGLRRLITSQDRRLEVDAIKKHPFFLGVNWATIRSIEAPFIPRLRSITDTSYFPTEELEQVPEQPADADSSGANKDLAFLGYVSVLRSSRVSRWLTHAGCPTQVHVQTVHDLVAGLLMEKTHTARLLV